MIYMATSHMLFRHRYRRDSPKGDPGGESEVALDTETTGLGVDPVKVHAAHLPPHPDQYPAVEIDNTHEDAGEAVKLLDQFLQHPEIEDVTASSKFGNSLPGESNRSSVRRTRCSLSTKAF